MNRRTFISGMTLGVLAAPLVARAQQAGKVWRIGYLDQGSAARSTLFVDGLRQGLRDLGWVEGRNIAVEVRFAEGKTDQLPTLAAELVRLKVDLIVTSTTPAALAAKQATTTIPIVIGFAADPVGSGIVASLARPGGREYAEVGGLMVYGANVAEMHRQLGASLVDKVLRGANPANLPVAQPTKFDLVINLKTARALGLAIPPSLLLRADQVLE